MKPRKLIMDGAEGDGGGLKSCLAMTLTSTWIMTLTTVLCCIVCECNLHARQCRFNMKEYIESRFVSGGVCRKCKHNTAGNHCEVCRDEYYINPHVAIDSKDRCILSLFIKLSIRARTNILGMNKGGFKKIEQESA